MFTWLRRLLIGTPLPSSRAMHEHLVKILALPIFASDAISSVAYATEEILLALIVAGPALITAGNYSIFISVAIIVLLAIVVTSYRQTIFAYPSGGGSYIVAKENLGVLPGLTAGASLMVDYVLTVAVSVSSGVAAIVSIHPDLAPYTVDLAIGAVIIIMLANLRGVKESGTVFAIPSYLFIISALSLIGVGVYHVVSAGGFTVPTPPPGSYNETPAHDFTGFAMIFLVLKAFASGCSAMTGTEAISNGIPAFQPPQSKNAATTLVWMAILLSTLFFGITFLAWKGNVIPMEQTADGYKTVVAQIAGTLFTGKLEWFVKFLQYATAAILLLAANTSFAGFPRLGSIMARDRFLPRQLYNVGDRLVFSNGIVLLALLAIGLIIAFDGIVNALIPLYAIGVFLSFTLSQAGMVRHTLRLKERGWQISAFISGIGAVVTAIVCIIQGWTKFLDGEPKIIGLPYTDIAIPIRTGAWIVLVLIPLLAFIFYKIH
ncbi:MAG: APC family permease, partial [Armatimonadota bacterium]